ncbi:neuromedin-U receptor 1-like [Mytilus californianus]|uniref:neuromedin-U receptor 1-like n=1 Tax=Mytilus californianus TaxID=6549 RepID=UPI00224764B8|nr:neuromedin-U receptor 1-like [Mytilus californianus]
MAGNYTNSDMTLDDFNDKETAKRTSAIVYLSVVMALGIPGNLLVIIVYFGSLRRRDGTHWMYIRALAITDLLVCTVAIPFELFQQTHQLTFYSAAGCSVFRSISVHLSLTSSLLLIAMSGNRLRRVCQPLKKQLTTNQGYVTIAIVVGIALLFCWPEGALSGISLEKLDNNLTGYDCSFSDRFSGENYTMIYSTVLLTVYISCMLALVIMYSIVGRKVIERTKFQKSLRRKYSISPSSAATEATASNNHTTDTMDYKSECEDEKSIAIEIIKHPGTTENNDNKKHKGKRKTVSEKKPSKKVTRIAFVISFCFILSYLPYVAVKLNASVIKGRFIRTPLTKAIFPILARTYIINNTDFSIRRFYKIAK